jgi:hypothetical protein
MQKDTQIFLGGVDYSGISGSELTRVIIRKPRDDARAARREDARQAFLSTFGTDLDNPSKVETIGGGS